MRYEGDFAPALGFAPYGRAVEEIYGSREAWTVSAISRLRSWGFNTLGSWSDPELYTSGLAYTHNLNMARSVPGKPIFPDVFAQSFESTADRVAAAECAPRSQDPALLGYYLDNELHWGESWHSDQGLLSLHFATEPEAPGRIAAIAYLRSTYETIEQMNRALDADLSSWAALEELAELRDLGPHIAMAQRAIQGAFFDRLVESGAITRDALFEGSKRMVGGSIQTLNRLRGTNFESFDEAFSFRPLTPLAERLRELERGFSAHVAARSFQVTTEAIRRHDPNHMILGVRFGGVVFEPVARAMGPWVEIASMNPYRTIPGPELGKLHT